MCQNLLQFNFKKIEWMTKSPNITEHWNIQVVDMFFPPCSLFFFLPWQKKTWMRHVTEQSLQKIIGSLWLSRVVPPSTFFSPYTVSLKRVATRWKLVAPEGTPPKIGFLYASVVMCFPHECPSVCSSSPPAAVGLNAAKIPRLGTWWTSATRRFW